jgi:hypothetical protein
MMNVTHPQPAIPSPDVMRLRELPLPPVADLLSGYGLALTLVPDRQAIEGSYWGDEEAGLADGRLLARADTPVHSVLHEACHWICMPPARRNRLHTNAGGDYDEENAVCYLQILLACRLPGMDQQRMCTDMDRWGYTFRLGSADAWFREDAGDARDWLLAAGLIDASGVPTGKVRA